MQKPDPRMLYFLSGEVDDSSPGNATYREDRAGSAYSTREDVESRGRDDRVRRSEQYGISRPPGCVKCRILHKMIRRGDDIQSERRKAESPTTAAASGWRCACLKRIRY